MTHNDLLRRIRYILDLSDSNVIAIFGLANQPVTRAQICNWLKTEEDADYQPLKDQMLASFLNGLIVDKRGQREGERPKPEKRLSNNMIFMKLKIALNLKTEDILAILALNNFPLSKHELSAFFRKQDHKHYRLCKDQVLRNFLKGLQLRYRGKTEMTVQFQW
ncbi:DUF1456 family protein [Aestuariirhabdus sp. LZHN29]|uniref:DUF1456 family protein n=1 Tax=Aestuariirhabdus sp. LZHN29 TaxID=3417462 RepID=UPI003CEB7E03